MRMIRPCRSWHPTERHRDRDGFRTTTTFFRRRLAATLVVLTSLVIAPGPALATADEPTFRDIYGAEHTLAEFWEKPTEVIVLVYMDPDCPVVQQYIPRLIEIHKKYNGYTKDRTGIPIRKNESGRWVPYQYPGDRVRIMGMYPAVDMSVKDIAEHALDKSVPFRVFHDHRQSLLRRLNVTELGEVVVMDRQGKVRYQGTIDNQFFPGGAKPKPTEHYLLDAIDAVLDGKDVSVSKRPPQGCIITKTDDRREYPTVTWHEHVEPIFQAKCQQCHRPGEVGPMHLLSHEDVYEYGEMIEEVVLDKRMPPWPAVSKRKFNDDIRLTPEERQTVIAWVRTGMKQGDPSKAQPAKQWPKRGEWRIGKPDFVFEMPEPVKIPASGLIEYVYYPVKVNFPQDKYIKAIETIPGTPEVVHHIQVHEFNGKIKAKGGAGLSPIQQLFLYGPSVEGAKLLGAYTPGNNENARVYGADRGMKLTGGANLIFELHYTPNGTATTDRSKVGIIFADKPPKKELKTHFFFRKRGDFFIPANVSHHSLQHLYQFEKPVRILGMRPHQHSRGKSYRLELVNSKDVGLKDIHDIDSHDKLRGEVVLSLPVWDFNWQRTYQFAEPLIVPRGKALLATGYWDNGRQNPRNPDWKVDVPWGQQTAQEMFNTLFIYEELDDKDPALLSLRK